MWQSRRTIGGETVRLAAGRMAKPGQARGVVFLPGLYGTDASWAENPDALNFCDYGSRGMLGMGVAVNETWGNSTMRTRLTTTIDAAQALGHFAGGKVNINGGSMGGICALQWALRNPSRVASIQLAICPPDLQSTYDRDWGGILQDSIDAAYGGRPPDSENPAKRASELRGIPITMWYSTNDPIAVASETEDFAEESGATLISMGAVGHAFDFGIYNGAVAAAHAKSYGS